MIIYDGDKMTKEIERLKNHVDEFELANTKLRIWLCGSILVNIILFILLMHYV
jgi:hypothetical protein